MLETDPATISTLYFSAKCLINEKLCPHYYLLFHLNASNHSHYSTFQVKRLHLLQHSYFFRTIALFELHFSELSPKIIGN